MENELYTDSDESSCENVYFEEPIPVTGVPRQEIVFWPWWKLIGSISFSFELWKSVIYYCWIKLADCLFQWYTIWVLYRVVQLFLEKFTLKWENIQIVIWQIIDSINFNSINKIDCQQRESLNDGKARIITCTLSIITQATTSYNDVKQYDIRTFLSENILKIHACSHLLKISWQYKEQTAGQEWQLSLLYCNE